MIKLCVFIATLSFSSSINMYRSRDSGNSSFPFSIPGFPPRDYEVVVNSTDTPTFTTDMAVNNRVYSYEMPGGTMIQNSPEDTTNNSSSTSSYPYSPSTGMMMRSRMSRDTMPTQFTSMTRRYSPSSYDTQTEVSSNSTTVPITEVSPSSMPYYTDMTGDDTLSTPTLMNDYSRNKEVVYSPRMTFGSPGMSQYDTTPTEEEVVEVTPVVEEIETSTTPRIRRLMRKLKRMYPTLSGSSIRRLMFRLASMAPSSTSSPYTTVSPTTEDFSEYKEVDSPISSSRPYTSYKSETDTYSPEDNTTYVYGNSMGSNDNSRSSSVDYIPNRMMMRGTDMSTSSPSSYTSGMSRGSRRMRRMMRRMAKQMVGRKLETYQNIIQLSNSINSMKERLRDEIKNLNYMNMFPGKSFNSRVE